MSQSPKGKGKGKGNRGGLQPSPRRTELPDRTRVSSASSSIQSSGASQARAPKPPPASFGIVRAPPRPGHVLDKNEYTLLANYFRVEVTANDYWRFQIEVKLKTKDNNDNIKKPTGVKLRELVRKGLKRLEPAANSFASDFKSIVVAVQKPHNLSCEVADENEPSKMYIVTLIEAKKVDIREILNFLQEMHKNWAGSLNEGMDSLDAYTKPLEVLDILGLVISHPTRVHDGFVTVGRSRFFDTRGSPGWLNPGEYTSQVLNGFWQSVRPTNDHFLLNVNVSNAAFLPPISLKEYIEKSAWYKCYDHRDHMSYYRALASRLTGVRIKYEISGQKRFKTIRGLAERRVEGSAAPAYVNDLVFKLRGKRDSDGKLAGMSTNLRNRFEENSGGTNEYAITIKEYFRLQYGRDLIKILPVIDLGGGCYVGAELCTINGWQLFRGDLGSVDAAEMIKKTVLRPHGNKKEIENAPSHLKLKGSELLKKFGITVGSQMLEVKGRQLTIPKLSYRNGKALFPRNGQWNIQSCRLHSSGTTMGKLFYIYFNPRWRRGEEVIDDTGIIKTGVEQLLSQMQKDVGELVLNNRKLIEAEGVPLEGGTFEDIAGRMREHFEAMRRRGTGIPRTWLVVLPDDRGLANAIYKFVKKLGDVDYGFHTISIIKNKLLKTSQERVESIYGNIALKFNLKAGGINHLVHTGGGKASGGIELIGEGRTMVVGYDVSHPTGVNSVPRSNTASSKKEAGTSKGGGEGKGKEKDKGKEDENLLPPSFVGLVASVDGRLSCWPAVAWTNGTRVELLDRATLEEKLLSRLRIWEGRNKALPEHIVVYRDGVSEGQYREVLDTEVSAIRDASAGYYKKKGRPPPGLLFVVTVKRHQTRFFASQTGGGTVNPNPGLAVDKGITVSRQWDFYLQPHAAMQGTARPIHYTVLYDDFFRKKFGPNAAGHLERMTHDMCYAFGRATKAVSICPPVYYADLVCARAKIHWEEHQRRPGPSQGQGQGQGKSFDPLRIHERCRDDMYYI